MNVETRHRTFNPLAGLPGCSAIDAICTGMQTDGWELIRIVLHHQFESVAVFQRLSKEEARDSGGSYL